LLNARNDAAWRDPEHALDQLENVPVQDERLRLSPAPTYHDRLNGLERLGEVISSLHSSASSTGTVDH
jgi:hypothetical protein